MKDKSSNKGNGRTSISAATKCCDDPYQRKRKFSDGNVPSSSGATCSSSNLGRPVYSKQKFDDFRKDMTDSLSKHVSGCCIVRLLKINVVACKTTNCDIHPLQKT
jgi:hypothetical protein